MATVYTTTQTQEELAALFSRNLTLNPVLQPAPVPAPVQASEPEQKIVYISQHYNHSAHLARQQQEIATQPTTRPASEPPQSEHVAVERVLREHHIDPSALSTAQLQLFKTVDTPEKLRLLELWRVCPPTSSTDNPTLAWSATTLEQEEALARMRFEQQLQQEAEQQLQQELQFQSQFQQQTQHQQRQDDQETVMSLDGTPLTPIQAGDGRWIAASDTEPYMAHGYYEEMMLAAAAATDGNRREYTDSSSYVSSCNALYAEAVTLGGKEAGTGCPPGAVRMGGGGTSIEFNPAHRDPVYGMGMGVDRVDWGRREAEMADRYGRMVGMREDEEML